MDDLDQKITDIIMRHTYEPDLHVIVDDNLISTAVPEIKQLFKEVL